LYNIGGNQWNAAASFHKLIMNLDGSIVLPSNGGDERKWRHAFASKGFPVLDVIMQKAGGNRNNANSVNSSSANKTTVFYYEVRIEEEHDRHLHFQ
jgi:hypothetical protein